MILQRPFNDDTFILFFLSWKGRWKVQVFNEKDILVSCDKNQLKKYILQVILNWKHNFICRIYRGITVQLIDDLKLQMIFELEMTRSDIFRSIRFENTGLKFLFKYCLISHTYLHSTQHILIWKIDTNPLYLYLQYVIWKGNKNAPFEIITTTLSYIFSFSGKGKVKVYDDKGILVSCKKDLCDCMDDTCPGCHFPCPKCRSNKCGHECRQVIIHKSRG